MHSRGWLHAGREERGPPAPHDLLLHRCQMNQRAGSGLEPSRYRSKEAQTESRSTNSRAHPRTARTAAGALPLYATPCKASPARDTCSSGSGPPSAPPSCRSDVSATAELLATAGFPLGSPGGGFIGTAGLVLMLPERDASSSGRRKRLGR